MLYNSAMNPRPLIWIGVFIGSTIGGLVPELWGAGFLSFSSAIFSMLGGIIGIFVGYKIATIL